MDVEILDGMLSFLGIGALNASLVRRNTMLEMYSTSHMLINNDVSPSLE